MAEFQKMQQEENQTLKLEIENTKMQLERERQGHEERLKTLQSEREASEVVPCHRTRNCFSVAGDTASYFVFMVSLLGTMPKAGYHSNYIEGPFCRLL